MLAIIGCGNTNRSDDGVGVHVAQELLRIGELPGAVKVFDAGTAGMEVMFQARGCQKLIVVDACSSGSEPGAIFEVPGSEVEDKPQSSFNLHDFRWDNALFAGRQIFKEDFPEDVKAILIEASSLDFGLELSAPVKQAASRIIKQLKSEISHYPSSVQE